MYKNKNSMKRNKIVAGAVLLMGALTMASCSKSFLEPTPKGTNLESEYYTTPTEAFNGLVAAYAPMQIDYHEGYCSSEGLANAASDECYSGGASATDQVSWTAMNNMTLLTPTIVESDGGLWSVPFIGITACNQLLANLSTCGLDDATLAQYTAECEFLRAYYYFRLVRWFGNVPLFTSAMTLDMAYSTPQATPEQVYTQIEADLNAAIPNLPLTVSGANLGRASQGEALALLGKVYLYDKKYDSAAIELAKVNGTPGGTSTYGYHLLANYGDIFSVTNKFNAESILEIQHSSGQNYGDWSGNSPVGNTYAIMCGPRNYSFTKAPAPNMNAGWGFTPITYDLYNAMVVNGVYDPRYQYTIYNIDSLMALGLCSYGQMAWTQGFPTTGYWIVKYAPLKADDGAGNEGLNYGNDYIEIRLADTYLMEAEAIVQGGGDMSRAMALVNAVRARVGLPALTGTLTMDEIKNERHLELATEGHRWFDLVRWGDANQVLNNMANGFSKHFVAGKNEILPIPLNDLTNTQLKQNPGY